MKFIDEFRNSDAAAVLTKQIADLALSLPAVKIMEVCGSHTMAIARSGLKSILPDNIRLVSGPGCPVCVTDSGYIDTAIELGKADKVIATFGDMLRVPGSKQSLTEARREGVKVQVCYSPLAALELAQKNPAQEIVFLGIGFETTIAPVVKLVELAIRRNVNNVSLLPAFKQVPPILNILSNDPELAIDGFICPPHVSAIIGSTFFDTFACQSRVPCAIASFEAVEILLAVKVVLDLLSREEYRSENLYKRVVKPEGNSKAQAVIQQFLEPCDAAWRGIGVIADSGLRLKPEYCQYDATVKFNQPMLPGTGNRGCQCGEVLKGVITPEDCRWFGNKCTPEHPVGPCMVSSEGSCAASFKYARI